ncbi:MAG: hypothetical protein NXI32_06745, partial [bacterium]|nr:hypothetical protein [bacterium]
MSSISNSPPKSTAKSKTPASDAVRQALHSHLRKTAAFIRLMEVLGQFFGWLAAVLVLWLLACVIDHWLIPLPSFLRWAFWTLAVAGTSVWVVLYLAPLLFRRISLTYAAQRIEHLVPEFKNGLISWLELENLPDNGVPRGVMAALAFRAKRFIGDQDPSATVDTSPLIKLVGSVLVLTTVMVVYTMISPKSVVVTGKRVLMPWASLASPSRVEILDVQPGSVEITQGQPLDVDVEVRGLRQDEPVFVRFSTVDGQIVDRRQELGAVTEGFRYSGAVKTDERGVQQELDYWIEAGDAQQGPFRVLLNPLPTVVVEAIELRYPAYTKLPNRTLDGSAVVEAVEGTEATIRATANQSMKRAVLEVNPEIDDRQELIRAAATRAMKIDGRQLSSDWLMQLDEDKSNPTEVQYRIRGYNQRLEANPSPLIYSMSVLADLPPEVTLVGPQNRTLRVAPTAVVELEVRASDPDYGLSKLKLQVRKNSKVVGETTLIDDLGLTGRQVRTTKLDLKRLQVEVGDRVQLLAAAQDNRHDPVSKQWAPGVALSEPLLLEVVGPEQNPDVPPQAAQSQSNSERGSEDAKTEAAGDQSAGQPSGSGDSAATEGGSQDPSGQNPNDQGSGNQAGQQPSGEQQTGASSAGGQSAAGEQVDSNSGEGDSQASGNASESGASASSASGDSSQRSGATSPQNQSANVDSNTQSSGASQSSQGNRTGSNGASDPSASPSSASQDSGGASSSSNNASRQQMNDAEVMERVQQMMQREAAASEASSGQSGSDRSGAEAQQAQGADSASNQTASEQQASQADAGQNAAASAEKPQGTPSDAASADPTQSSAGQDATSQQNANPTGSQQPGTQAQNAEPQAGESGKPNESQQGEQATPQRESGDAQSSGNQQSGNQASGNQASGNQQSGNQQSGNQQSGDQASGKQQSAATDSSSRSGQDASSSDSASQSNQSQGDSQAGQQPAGSGQQSGNASQSAQSDAGSSTSSQGGSAQASESQSSQAGQQQSSQSGEQQTSAGQDGKAAGQSQSEAADSQPSPSGSGGASSQQQPQGSGKQDSQGRPQDDSPPTQESSGASGSNTQSGPPPSGSQSSSSQSDSTPGSANSGMSSNQGRTSGAGAS